MGEITNRINSMNAKNLLVPIGWIGAGAAALIFLGGLLSEVQAGTVINEKQAASIQTNTLAMHSSQLDHARGHAKMESMHSDIQEIKQDIKDLIRSQVRSIQ